MAAHERVMDALLEAEGAWEQDDLPAASAAYAHVAELLAVMDTDEPLEGEDCLIAVWVATRRAELAGLAGDGSGAAALLEEAVVHWDAARAGSSDEADGRFVETIAKIGGLATVLGADQARDGCFDRIEVLVLEAPPAALVLAEADNDPARARAWLHEIRAGRWFLAAALLARGQDRGALEQLDGLVTLHELLEDHPALADDPLFEPMAVASLLGRYLRLASNLEAAADPCVRRHERLTDALVDGYAEATREGDDTVAAVAISFMLNAIELAPPCGRSDTMVELVALTRTWVDEQCAAQNVAVMANAAELHDRLHEMATER